MIFRAYFYCHNCGTEWSTDTTKRKAERCPECPNIYHLPFDMDLLSGLNDDERRYTRTLSAPGTDR